MGHISDTLCDSHRAECYGILGGILTWKKIQQDWGIDANKVILLCCDNLSALNFAGNVTKYRFITGKLPDFDVLQGIREAMGTDYFDIKHVKGHQDKGNSNLDFYAVLNIHVDKLAREAGNNIPINQPSYLPVDGCVWELFTGPTKIYKDLQQQVIEWSNREPIKQYWNKKKKVSCDHFDEVYWEAIGKEMKNSSTLSRIWITKRAAKECGANAVLFRRNQKDTDKCRLCGEIETVLHVYKCSHKQAEMTWNTAIAEFNKDLATSGTNPIITAQLVEGLNKWRMDTLDNEEDLIYQQLRNGWDGILEGFLSIHWALRQDSYYNTLGSKKTGLQWAILTVRRLWKIAWTMWTNRNKFEHEKDEERQIIQIEEKLQAELEEGTQNIPNLERWFRETEVERAKGSWRYAKAWMRQVQAIRKRERRREENTGQIRRMRNFMHQYLGLQT
jgi:hypothetical protein